MWVSLTNLEIVSSTQVEGTYDIYSMTTEFEELSDLMELLDFTLSSKFIETWKHKYSEHFIKLFQSKIVESLKKEKPIKINSLVLAMKKNDKYSSDQITNFLKSIDVSLYYPVIQGKI